jgi:hypothetical protein
MSPFNPPLAGSPVQPQQPQYGQQPPPLQPQYYAPPMPDFSGILHLLAQHVSTLTQNSVTVFLSPWLLCHVLAISGVSFLFSTKSRST